MSRSLTTFLVAVTSFVSVSAADAAQIASNPISHGSGFSSVACSIVNVGSKPIVVEDFWMKQIVASPSYGVSSNGCSGSGPYTIQPGAGCTRRINDPTICNQPDACYCWANVGGSAKLLRGTIVGTVSGSTTTVSNELRIK